MSPNYNFYVARAAGCAIEADAAVLPNVRERCLRAELAWLAMAERVLQTETGRRLQAADKAAAAEQYSARYGALF
jgi:hypothetical protein